MLNVTITDVAIITTKNVDYRSIIYNISKSEAINLLKNSVLEDHRYVCIYWSCMINRRLKNMCDKAILENGGILKSVLDCYKNQ